MNEQITRFLNWAGNTKVEISPAIAMAWTVGFTMAWNRWRGAK